MTTTNFPYGINSGTIQVGGTIAGYSLTNLVRHAATLTPAAVAADETAEQTFAVGGVLSTDMVLAINKPTAQAGLGIVGGRVIAAGTIGVTFANVTAAAITPTAGEVYEIAVATLT